jgi:hypothetical protein
VDATILSLTNEIEKARNIKLLVYIYEQMLGSKINFEKSEVPISTSRLHVADWVRLEKKLDTWQGNSLSSGGRAILIKSSLSNVTIDHMSMYLLLKTTIEKLEKIRRKIF